MAAAAAGKLNIGLGTVAGDFKVRTPTRIIATERSLLHSTLHGHVQKGMMMQMACAVVDSRPGVLIF